MNVRLVAYRPATTTATSDSTYQLDLQEAPNISLNFQFADIKEPDKRKASYSQTFKLPFTQKNNAFFQTWFNVNLETPVFNSRKRFAAVLYVGTVPQFEGVIQLKGVYLKAGYYDVVLMSNSANLFTKIGSKKLKDVFKLFSSTGVFLGYSQDLNHVYDKDNIVDSWNGSSNAFENTAGTPLRDSDAGVQKVMYPFSFTMPKAWYSSAQQFLNLDSSEISSLGQDAAKEVMVDILQFRPAIQIKYLFKRIMAVAGFSYTSTFLDSAYFGKLFMTTCNTKATPGPIQYETAGLVDGFMSVGHNGGMWTYIKSAGQDFDCLETNWFQFRANTVSPIDSSLYSLPYDPTNLWNETTNTFKKESSNMVSVNIQFVAESQNIMPSGTSTNPATGGDFTCQTNEDGILWEIEIRDSGGNVVDYFYEWITQAYDPISSLYNYTYVDIDVNLSAVNTGDTVSFWFRPRYYRQMQLADTAEWKFGSNRCMPEYVAPATFNACAAANYLFSGLYSKLTVSWVGYETNQWEEPVDVPSGIDDSLTQKGFLKDLIQRFNLVILSDPNNPANLIIEPYNEFIGSGELKDWTNKLDLSKEVIVKDTTSMQKAKVLFTDLEDNDLLNKSIKEEQPNYNVFGKLDIRETNNEFATGEMKNDPMFSPYINEKIFANNNDDADTNLVNVAAQYEYTYKKVENGYEDVLEATKPKLFYYSGTPTTIMSAAAIYMHPTDAFTGNISAESFTTYPLCSPFELTTSAAGTATITGTTKSLYWNLNGPLCGQLTCFNYLIDSDIIGKSLYYAYWSQYLNGLYDTEARIMECHLNLNEVDIFNFKFSDQIFIKDTYWRILTISNYQVGAKASTKATLVKIDESYGETCFDCDYVLGDIEGSNTVGPFYVWCPDSTPSCTPNITSAGGYEGLLTTIECCECNNGKSLEWYNNASFPGLYPCIANTGSLPYQIESVFATRNMLNRTTTKSLYSGKLNGINQPLLVGANTKKFTSPIFPYFGNDIIIKYDSRPKGIPQLNGESHRIVLSGNTTGNTRGYGYVNGDSKQRKLPIPLNTNIILRIKGTATVVGGTSSTYILGYTEGFAWYTVFKNVGGTITQLSTAGGQQEFSVREGANPTTCTLNIVANGGSIEFGLDDDQTDTKRIWSMTADIDVNIIYNMERNFDDVFAQYQNYDFIKLQNNQDLIWN
mgnify:CR=1 FL=1